MSVCTGPVQRRVGIFLFWTFTNFGKGHIDRRKAVDQQMGCVKAAGGRLAACVDGQRKGGGGALQLAALQRQAAAGILGKTAHQR